MKTYYHGTTADNVDEILKHGLLADLGGEVWTISGNFVYAWSPDRLVEIGEVESLEDAHELAFRLARESAECALGHAKKCQAVVITIETDIEFETDESEEIMVNSGSVRTTQDIPAKDFTSIQISNDLSLLKGYFISLMMDRDYSNISFTNIEMKIAKSLMDAIYPEDVDDITTFEEILKIKTI